MACGGLPAVLLGLEVRRWCWVSVWESEEDSEAWASVVCPLSLAGDSAHRLPGDFTCASGAESDLTWRPVLFQLPCPVLVRLAGSRRCPEPCGVLEIVVV